MGRKTRFLFLILAAALLFCSLAPVRTFEVRDRKSGDIFFHEKVAPGDRFHFRYIHSVEKTPVEGIFAIEEDRWLRIIETRFSSHGPGLSHVGERMPDEEGWFVQRGGDRHEKLTFLFSPSNQPVLKFKQKEILLLPEKGEGGLLEFAVKKDRLILHMLKKLYLAALSIRVHKYTNVFLLTAKTQRSQRRWFFCSGGERPPEQKPPPLRDRGFVRTLTIANDAIFIPPPFTAG